MKEIIGILVQLLSEKNRMGKDDDKKYKSGLIFLKYN